MDSILTSIKKLLGISEEYTHFDSDLIMHINTVLGILTQLGIGPSEGFSIKDATDTWEDFIPPSPATEMIKSYIAMKVRLMFDPPQSSAVSDAISRQISELEFRLLITAETK